MAKPSSRKPESVRPVASDSHALGSTSLATPPTNSLLPPWRVQGAANWLFLFALGLVGLYFVYFFQQSVFPGQPASGSRAGLFSIWLVPEDLVQNANGHSRQAATGFALLDRAPLILVGGLYLLAAWGVGTLLLSPLVRTVSLSHLEQFVFSQGLGLQALSLLTLLLGLLLQGRAMALAIQAMLACGLIAAIFQCRFAVVGSRPFLQTPVADKRSLYFFGLLFLLALPIFLGAMLPPTDFDVREYHLQVPKEWFQQGQITFLPHNIYGNMPLGAEMPAFACSHCFSGDLAWWWGALAGKFIIGYFAWLTALALWAFGERMQCRWWGIAAAAFYLSNPWIVHVSTQGLNEGVYACYLLLAGYLFLLALQHGNRLIFYSGLFAGAAASCKYPAVVFVVIPLAIATLLPWHRILDPKDASAKPWGARLRASLSFLAGTALSAGLWYAKNAILTANPVFPLLGSLFPTSGRTPQQVAQWSNAHAPPGYSWEALTSSLRPLFLQSEFASPAIPAFALLGLLLLGITYYYSRQEQSHQASNQGRSAPVTILLPIAAWVSFVAIAWWISTHRLERFLVPLIPLLLLFAGYAIAWSQQQMLPLRVTVLILAAVVFLYQTTASLLITGDNRWFVPLELLRADEPTGEQSFSRTSSTHRWLNANVQPGEAVLLVGDAQPFDLEMQVYYNTCFDRCLLVEWLGEGTHREKLQQLQSRRIRFVHIDAPELARYNSAGNYGYDPRLTQEFVDSLVLQKLLIPRQGPAVPDGLYEVPAMAQ